VAALNHLHLHVRDVARSKRFYEEWFGLREHVRHGDILFLRDERGLDLALAPDAHPAALPPWFHFGFRLPTAGDVAALHARMERERLDGLGPLHRDDDFVHFRARDPDGHVIEVYGE
jgi:catechol 2,3-dioxygenase-like lactoylglutathione lyase family enzyme